MTEKLKRFRSFFLTSQANTAFVSIHLLLNKGLARILISYPGLNEYEIFCLVLTNKYGDLKIDVFCNRQTKRNLLRHQWIDITFYAMRM